MASFVQDYAETVDHNTEIEDLVDAGGSVVLRLQAHLAGTSREWRQMCGSVTS